MDALIPILPTTIITLVKFCYPYTYFIKLSKFFRFIYDHLCLGLYQLDPLLFCSLPIYSLKINGEVALTYYRWRSWDYLEHVPHPTDSGRILHLEHVFCEN